jgi:dTMP kinase
MRLKGELLAKRTGLFITLEGPDGSGKSTQARLLNEKLRKAGYSVVLTREPGGSALAEKLRAVLLDPANRGLVDRAELLLFEAARAQHVQDTVLPALAQGKVVLCDRFTDSTTAYQVGGRGLKAADVAWLNRYAAGAAKPDLTLCFDIPVTAGLQRAQRAKGSKDRMERTEVVFRERVRKSFLAPARLEPRRIKRIAVAAKDVQAVADEAWALVAPRLKVLG